MNCPPFLQEQAKLKILPPSSPERAELISKLKTLVCNKEEYSVCCRTDFEIIGGVPVTRVEDFPYVARINFKTSFGSRSFCGASLIHARLLLTAKHCIANYFLDNCIEESDCYAKFRDLVPGPSNHERGEFTVPIVDMFEKEGTSDLAILKLAYAVCMIFDILKDSALVQVHEHPDYAMGAPLEPINIGIEEPKQGDIATTVAHRAKGESFPNYLLITLLGCSS